MFFLALRTKKVVSVSHFKFIANKQQERCNSSMSRKLPDLFWVIMKVISHRTWNNRVLECLLFQSIPSVDKDHPNCDLS